MAENVDIRVRADTAQAKRGLGEVTGSMKSMVTLAQSAELRNFGRQIADGFKSIVSAAKSATDATVKYAEQVRKLSYLTGTSAEETSRLIQLADDLAIDYTELGTALKAAANKGIDPSTESLAKLSDEYMKLNPGLERSQFLLDNFGRSGMALAPLLERGSDEIRGMSAAIDKNLILTDKQVQNMRQYELTVDNFNDRIQGLKYSIGNDLVGAFLQLNEPMQNFILGIGAIGPGLINAVAGVGNLVISMRALATTMNAFALSPGGMLLLAIAGGAALAALPALAGLYLGSKTGITKKLTGFDPLASLTGNSAPAAAVGPAATAAPAVIYNNYGVDANNQNLINILKPYINQILRGNGQR